jgi:transcriptional regulator with XRE-family HTH domain
MGKKQQNLSGRGRKPSAIEGRSFRHQVARRIRERRLDLQLRAEDAARLVGDVLGRPVNVQTWYHWERATHPFDIDTLPAIAKALGLSPHQLLPEESSKDQRSTK